MHEIDLRDIDLNLLVVLEVLLQERNVSRAAKRIGRTQSATSHALSRLREVLDDPILVRIGGEMRATPRAEALGAQLSGVLGTMRRMLSEKGAFDPATTERTFSLLAPDVVSDLVPSLYESMVKEAPAVGLELRSVRPQFAAELGAGKLDLVIAPRGGMDPSVAEGLRTQHLGALTWVVYARAGHPAIERWSSAEWARWPHIQMRVGTAGPSRVEEAAQAHGLARRVTVVVPHFSMAPALLASSDLLFTVPREEMIQLAKGFGLVALEPPFPIEPFRFSLYWSAHLDQDPAQVWFRRHVTQAFVAMVERGEALKVAPRRAS